jgi:AcrR family transcriptional regulator
MDKKQQLYETAKQIFSEKGFKETNIAAITKAAHMAVGTFYLYYTSKEQIFMEIYRNENTALKHACLARLDMAQPPIAVIRQMLQLNQEGIAGNPILREWYRSDAFRQIEASFREENAGESLGFLYDTFLELIERWQTEGVMRSDIPAQKIMLMFAALVNVDTHKDEIGLEHFPELLDMMTDLLVNSLTNCTR